MNDFNDTMTFALLTIQFYSVVGLILSDNATLSHLLLATLILPAIPLLSHASRRGIEGRIQSVDSITPP